MKRDIRMIGLDLDGTTLTDHSSVSPRVKAAIQKALAAGVVVLPATGRALEGIPPEILEIPGIHYALTANGANVTDLTTKTTVYSDCFEKQHALEILEFLHRYNVAVALYLNGNGYAEEYTPEQQKQAEAILPASILTYLKMSRVYVPNLTQFITQSPHGVEKFTMMFYNADERARAIEEARARGDISVTWALATGMEINTLTANKGSSLVALGRLLGISQPQIMAIGDGHNDIEMLQTVGYGVAMGNAEQAVKDAADAVTLPCSEDGVAAAIEAIL